MHNYNVRGDMYMKKFVMISLSLCTLCTQLLCEELEIHSSVTKNGKPLGVFTLPADSKDTIKKLIADIEQDLKNNGIKLATTAQPKKNDVIITKIEKDHTDLMNPALQDKTLATVFTSKRQKKESVWQRLKKMNEPSSPSFVAVSVELATV